MDNKRRTNIRKVMKILNITSEQDLNTIIDYLETALEAKTLESQATEDGLSYAGTRKPPSNREKHLYNINALANHFEVIYGAWRHQIYPSLKAVESPLASKLYDRFTDGGVFLMCIKRAAEAQLLPGESPRIN